MSANRCMQGLKSGQKLGGIEKCLGVNIICPRSCGWLNGSHPALLIGGRGNSDVQLAMRMPITAASHWKNCSQECVGQADLAALQRVMQAAQAAQIGYSTDYLTKRQAKGLYECREFARGHAALSGKLVEEGAAVGQVTRRHAQRLVADCFVRGVARGAVETENLKHGKQRGRGTTHVQQSVFKPSAVSPSQALPCWR